MFKKLLAVVTVMGFSFAAFADHHAVPATWTEFEKYTFEQMKGLPDFKWSLTKPVHETDLKGKSETEVVLLRNSIYAQHGFRFSQKPLANYFLSRSWYKPNLDTLGTDKLSPVSRKNVEVFMKFQASFKNPDRDVASRFGANADAKAYNLFKMGFCTYDVSGERKAGLIVFEPGGKAKVVHSKASRAALENYAYRDYLEPSTGDMGQMLLDATWSLQGDSVLLDFTEDVYSRFDSQTLARGTRKVIQSISSNATIAARNCTMVITK